MKAPNFVQRIVDEEKYLRAIVDHKPHWAQRSAYNRWYYSCRKLGVPTRGKFKTPAEIRKRNLAHYYRQKKK